MDPFLKTMTRCRLRLLLERVMRHGPGHLLLMERRCMLGLLLKRKKVKRVGAHVNMDRKFEL